MDAHSSTHAAGSVQDVAAVSAGVPEGAAAAPAATMPAAEAPDVSAAAAEEAAAPETVAVPSGAMPQSAATDIAATAPTASPEVTAALVASAAVPQAAPQAIPQAVAQGVPPMPLLAPTIPTQAPAPNAPQEQPASSSAPAPRPPAAVAPLANGALSMPLKTQQRPQMSAPAPKKAAKATPPFPALLLGKHTQRESLAVCDAITAALTEDALLNPGFMDWEKVARKLGAPWTAESCAALWEYLSADRSKDLLPPPPSATAGVQGSPATVGDPVATPRPETTRKPQTISAQQLYARHHSVIIRQALPPEEASNPRIVSKRVREAWDHAPADVRARFEKLADENRQRQAQAGGQIKRKQPPSTIPARPAPAQPAAPTDQAVPQQPRPHSHPAAVAFAGMARGAMAQAMLPFDRLSGAILQSVHQLGAPMDFPPLVGPFTLQALTAIPVSSAAGVSLSTATTPYKNN